ncbi:MAG: exonuclease SbcC [Flavobacteriales bacterium]|jgi:exonuclease SbcC
MKLLKRAIALFQAEPQASQALSTSKTALREVTLPIEQLSESELQAVALGQSPKYSDAKQRCTAIKQIPYSDELLKLSSANDTDTSIRSQASKRCANHFDQSPSEANALIDGLGYEKLIHILQHCSAEPIAQHLFSKLSDEALFNFIRACKSAVLRKLIIEMLDNGDQLKLLLKQVKGKDKTSYRIIKDKLNNLKMQEDAVAAQESRVIALIDDCQIHSKRVFSSEFEFQTGSLQRRFDNNRSSLSLAQIENCEALLAICSETIQAQLTPSDITPAKITENKKSEDENTKDETAESDANESLKVVADDSSTEIPETQNITIDAPIDNAIKEATQLAVESFFETLQSIPKDSEDAIKNTANIAHVELCEKLEQIKALESFNEKAEQEHGNLVSQINQLINRTDLLKCLCAAIEKDTKLIDQSNKTLETLKRLLQKTQIFITAESIVKSVLHQLKTVLKQQAELSKQNNELAKSLVRRSQAAVNQGKLRRAQSFKEELDSILESGFQLPGYLSRELEKLDESYAKLADWDTYAVIPKLEALTSEMKALATTELTPEPLAAKIKRLQLEWKEASKGSLAADDAHWLAFKEASDIAYIPCKSFYDELGAERDQNFKVRIQLCEQLQHYSNNYNWDAANWNDVESLIQNARNEWKACGAVRHDKHKEATNTFNDALGRIQNKLTEEYDKRAAEKLILIALAEKSLSDGDATNAVNQAKKLQERWKTIGRCQARKDRELWQTFRRHCDAIFEKRNKDREDHKAQITENSLALDTTIASLNLIIKSKNEDFLEHVKTLDQQSLNNECLSKLPIDAQKRYQQKHAKSLEQIEQRRQSIKNETEVAEWLEVFELNRLALTQASSDFSTDDYLTRCKSLKGSAKACVASLEEKLERAENKHQDEDLRLLCVRVEIMTGSESPSSDNALRMQYQVKQLQENFGQKASSRATLVALVAEWMKASTANNTQYSALEARFIANWQKLKDLNI